MLHENGYFSFWLYFPPLGLESKRLARAPMLYFTLYSFQLSFLLRAPANKQTGKPTSNLSLLLQPKPQRLHALRFTLIGQGSDKGKCHLISFRQSSSTSFSPAKILCCTYNKNIGYVSIRAWVGIGRAYQRKETVV